MCKRLGHVLCTLLAVLLIASATAGVVLATRKTSTTRTTPRIPHSNHSALVLFPPFADNLYTLHNWFNEYYWDNPQDCNRDSSGVCVVSVGGTVYNHPVAQAMDGVWALDQFQQTGDVSELNLAEAEAGRLLSYKTTYLGDYWFPYPFSTALYGDPSDTTVAPWYSGMAQGVALDLFVNLWLATGNSSYQHDADLTFNTFLYPYAGDTSVPYVDQVDGNGYVWIEEYPTPNVNDDAMNGAGFGLWGVVDYALHCDSGSAAQLASGMLTTLLHYSSVVRDPTWISAYSVSHLSDRLAGYHGTVTMQFSSYWGITQDPAFAEVAAQFAEDYPITWFNGRQLTVTGTVTISDASGSTSTVSFTSPTTEPVDSLIKLYGLPGYWWQVYSGPYAGDYIQDSPSAYLPGWANEMEFVPDGTGTFPAGQYTEYGLQGGVLTQIGTLTLASPTVETVSYHATIDGMTCWGIDGGALQGDYLAGADPTF